nr:unnamed protein product [Callosobruchus analis]
MITEDGRGKHGNHFRVDEAIKRGVRQHIQSIPRIESHYCRSKSSREYIDGGKSLSQLHRDYVDNCIQKGETYANYLMFSRIFNYEYNIAFFSPKKDQCEDCMAFKVASDEEKISLKDEYENHLKEKELSRGEKKNDKNNSDEGTIVAVYDLQAVLQCPKGDVSTFYYTCKLNVFNLTVYEIKTHTAKCFMWDESEANRGVCEIGSCILRYIQSLEEKVATAPVDLIFYSDNCCGQQKNRFMFSMYLYAVQKFPYIKSITHKFLIKGHSQNEGDSVHSVIERSIKRSVKSDPIFTPQQYVTRTAKKSGEPYAVEELDHGSFFDLKELGTQMQLNVLKNTNNETVRIGDIKIVRCDKENPNQMLYKTSYSQENFDTIITKLSRRPKSSNFSLKRLYNSKPGFNTKKKESILTLFQKKKPPIPILYFPYFNSL